MTIPKIEYEEFKIINIEYCNKINFSYEEIIEQKIQLSINKKDIDKYNTNICYYKDLCYTAISEFVIDIC